MSHFAMIVTGDYDEALAPYHEYECTGEKNQYVQAIDMLEELRKKYANLKPKQKKKYPTFAQWLGEWYGYEEDSKYSCMTLDEHGNVTSAIKYTNPNAKWDWYQLGGRYSARLILKNGQTADTAKAGDVDWEANRKKKEDYASDEWNKVRKLVGDLPYTSWKKFYERAEAKEIDLDTARTEYHSQASVQAIKSDQDLMWIESSTIAEILSTDHDPYVTRQGFINGAYWGLLHDSKWAERGSMGWFGMSDSTNDSETVYASHFWSVVSTLDPNTQVSVIDCHI